MRRATIYRQPSTHNGIRGRYESDKGLVLQTIERPYLDNKPDVSSIPFGTYKAEWKWSSKHSCNLYHLIDVPDRSNVELHSANIYQQLLGCIAFGLEGAVFTRDSIRPGCPDRDMIGVTKSQEALARFEYDLFDGKIQLPFELTIKEA